MSIVGAIIGDIAGSQFEFDRCKDPDKCELFTEQCDFTDDTVMSLAVKYAIDNKIPFGDAMRRIGQKYQFCGYGGKFYSWMFSLNPRPYNSFGNGSAMRVSYVADHYNDLKDVQKVAKETALPTHNHPEGIRGAVVTATCIWMAKNGKGKQEIYDYVLFEYPEDKYKYSISRSIEELVPAYKWNETCQGSVPVAMRCFYESDSYESFLRNLFRLDCDTDTLAAIGGSVAEEFYKGTGLNNKEILNRYLDDSLLSILNKKNET